MMNFANGESSMEKSDSDLTILSMLMLSDFSRDLMRKLRDRSAVLSASRLESFMTN